MTLKPWAVALLALVVPCAAAAYEETPVKDGGAVTGGVWFKGRVPALDPIAVTKDRGVCGDEKPSEALAVGPDGGVRGSVILLEGVAKGKKGGADVVIDNAHCVFVHHVTAAGPGDRVRVKSSDPVLHNTHGRTGTTTVFNLALPNKEQTIDITRRLTTPGVVRVRCNAHPHMAAWLIVHDSPYYAVTDERGAFKIDGVPPGTYKVTMWHEGYRAKGEPVTVTRKVTVVPNGTASIDFELR